MAASSDHELSFLQGGGELGALIRSKDWSQTPLGPPACWPQSLRTALGILLNSRYSMFVFWGPKLVKIYNDGYRPITGHKHPWALGRPAQEVWPEIWQDIKPLVDRALAGDPTWSDDLLFMERNGFPEEVYFTFSYSPISDESGGVGGMFCACTETTGKVLGERRLRTLRDLAAARSEAHTVAEACALSADVLGANPSDVPFAFIYLLDDGGSARLAARAGVPFEGSACPATVERDAGSAGWPIFDVAESRVAQQVVGLRDLFDRVPHGPWPEPPASAMVLPLIDRGLEQTVGVLIAGGSSRRPFDDEYRGWFELVAGQISTSITNTRAAEEQRRRAEALAELDRAKTAFFSNVSHEFRTPLTLMLGPINDLLDWRGLPPDRRADLQVLARNTQRLLKLVNTLLDFARIEAGRAHAAYEPTDLAHLTVELASVFRSAIQRAGLQLTVDCPALPEPIYVDRDMWEKIVLNLLSNALKFTFSGGIDVSLRWTGDAAELTVADTGVGIPPADLPRIFDRFHRAERRRARTMEGTGIGLALAQELVRVHGGTIAVESEVDRGTRFIVRVPGGTSHLDPHRIGATRMLTSTALGAGVYVDEALRWLPQPDLGATGVEPVVRAEASRRDFSHDDESATRHTLLLVDDNADMRQYLLALLRERSDVEAVGDGTTALQRVQARRPDLVLTDVMMPGLDGFELLREIRRDSQLAGTPVIMLSARAGEESRIEGLQAGADDYLIKPFTARELMARIRSQLALAEARRAVEAERAQLYDLFMQAPAPICVIRGQELVFEMANAQYERVVGRSDLPGRRVFDVLPEARQAYEPLLRDVLERGVPHVAEESPVPLDRSGSGRIEEVYFTFIHAPMRSRSGDVDRVMALCNDVTEQVRARREMEQAWRRARDEAHVRETITANATSALFMMDDRQHCTFMNPAAEHLTGYVLEDVQGRPLHDFVHYLYPDGRPYPVEECPIDRALPARRQERGEEMFVRRDGTFYPVAFTASPIAEDSGRAIGTVVEVRDLTEEKRAGAERAELLRREQEARNGAEAANRAKDEFLAMLGHGLRNPLSPIVTALQLMRLKDADTFARERAILERQVQHVVRLVDDLLDVSKITRGKVERRRRVVSDCRRSTRRCGGGRRRSGVSSSPVSTGATW